MKIAIGLAVLGLTFSALASSGESMIIPYDGSQQVTAVTLRGEKTRTEYKTEATPWTCYREGIVGYETVCSGGPFPMGLPGSFPGGMHDPRNRYPMGMYPGYGHCNRMPIYRSVPYSCTRDIRSSYQVKEYDVEANVSVDIVKNSRAAVNEKLLITLNGDSLEIKSNSKDYLVVLNEKSAQQQMNGSVKVMDARMSVELVEAAPVLNALKLDAISIEDGILTVGMGPVNARENIALSLNITKKKLGADKLILERELAMNEVEIVNNRNGTEAKINVSKLGVELNGKYALTVKAAVKTRGTLLNRAALGELEATKTLIYSIR